MELEIIGIVPSKEILIRATKDLQKRLQRFGSIIRDRAEHHPEN
jgi:hypothetical protein